jgi:acid phosphatase
MKQKIAISRILTLIVTIFLCISGYAEPLNLGKLKTEIIHYHDSGTYQKDIEIVAANATRYIDAQVQNNAHGTHHKKLALILDIDETCLSNYRHMLTHDFSGLQEIIDQTYLAADAPAIKPMLALYQHALQEGIAVFFITGREEPLREATIRNLSKAGYANWTELKLQALPGGSVAAYKTSARASIEKQGYTIIASIGDQESDLVGGYTQKTFKLPNPYYHIPSDHHPLIVSTIKH